MGEYTPSEVDRLAQIIRTVDGNHDMGAGALAEAIADSGFLYDIRADERAKRPDREQIKEALAKVLEGQEAMHCTRVWEAWSYNTMTADDFSLVAEDDAALDEIVDAVLSSLALEPEARDEPRALPDDIDAEAAYQLCKGQKQEWRSGEHVAFFEGWRAKEATDSRIEAWLYVADHPALAGCYAVEGPLIDAVLARLSDLADTEQTIAELAPAPEARAVTDSEVEAAAKAIHGWENLGQVTPWESLPPGGPKTLHLNQARAALEAAAAVTDG